MRLLFPDLGIKCPEPEPPENGFIVGVETSVGSVVYVQCHQGYRLEGPTPMACIVTDEGAQWDPEVRRVCVEGSTDFDEDTQQNLNMAESAAQGTAPKQINRAAVNSQPSFIKSKAHPSKKHRTEFTEAVREEGEPTAEELEQVPEQCKPKPEAGPCRALFKRFYFNQITMECHTFFYGGCQGNQNNFQSIEECNLTCLPKHE
ncbi:WAP four-disulfide core domain protein 6A-like [Physella acuta]|uniref:WAP four-disulfide core domain protein 6A-like n=1 Tax=Physella acuta TaxID=109671 RepID=UPI0027DB1C63|nr:WAP four-disulfide core domain protein 6A-like [Physella acuta]